MESPVKRVFILSLALGAHGKTPHGCSRAIVREFLDDAESWPAVRTVGKGVKVSAVVWIEDF
jgi:hypothetical protein